MTKTAIIGVGSPFGADNLAWTVIEHLKKTLENSAQATVSLYYLDRPGMGLLDTMQGFTCAHIIDALVSNDAAGSIRHFTDLSAFKQCQTCLSSHNLGVAETLELGQQLNLLPQHYHIHTINLEQASPLAPMNQTIQQACQDLATQLLQSCMIKTGTLQLAH